MADLNCATFTGKVSSEAETKTIGSKGTLLTTFQLLNQTGLGPYQKTNIITVKIWGKYGESLKEGLKFGTPVGVTGELVCNQWGDQTQWDLMARSVTFITTPTEKPKPTEQEPDPRYVEAEF